MEQQIFNILATIAMGFLGIIWNTKGHSMNIPIKFILLLLAGAGFIITLHSFGYIVKIGG